MVGTVEGTMDPTAIVILLVVGAIAGWLASIIVKGGGLGLIGDIIVGLIGAVIGGFLMSTLGISIGDGLVPVIIDAVIGAVILLLLVRLVRRVI
jgi:uncharacterized membrane protein YeaQ/YmgE (transglycosylase-associated protein family)